LHRYAAGANALARNFSLFAGAVPGLLNVVSLAHSVLGGGGVLYELNPV
jgi:hypothetical protein